MWIISNETIKNSLKIEILKNYVASVFFYFELKLNYLTHFEFCQMTRSNKYCALFKFLLRSLLGIDENGANMRI